MATPFVIDIGCHSLKAGTAGDALPRVVTRSVVGIASVDDGFAAAAAAAGSSTSAPNAAAATSATGAAEPQLLQSLLNPLEKSDHVEVLPVMPYRATKLDQPGTYMPHSQGLERLLEEVLGSRCLDAMCSERSFLFAEPNKTSHEVRELFAELAFEFLHAPEVMLVRKAALAAFGCARTSAIVCDVGHSNTSVSAVQEGYVLQRMQQEIPLGCMQLLAVTKQLLQQQHISITPGFAVIPATDPAAAAAAAVQQQQQERVVVACPHVTKSFREFGEQHVLEVVLQLLGKCGSSSSSSSAAAVAAAAAEATKQAEAAAAAEGPFVLPDGTPLPPSVVAAVETAVPDLFFSATLRQQHRALLLPQDPSAAAAAAGAVTAQQQQQEAASVGVLECIRRCTDACQGAARRDVLGALVVAGGGSQFPGFVKRLKTEAPQLCGSSSSSSSGLRLVCSRGAIERHMASWIGGSIVGCLGTFSQLAITKKEYQEFGAKGCVDRKCP